MLPANNGGSNAAAIVSRRKKTAQTDALLSVRGHSV